MGNTMFTWITAFDFSLFKVIYSKYVSYFKGHNHVTYGTVRRTCKKCSVMVFGIVQTVSEPEISKFSSTMVNDSLQKFEIAETELDFELF